jgi:hypothetical protein
LCWLEHGQYYPPKKDWKKIAAIAGRINKTLFGPDDVPPASSSTELVPVQEANRPEITTPAEGIFLKVRRNQRTTITGKLRFTLDARLAVSAADHELIRKFKLGPLVVYDSANRDKYAKRAQEFLDSSRDRPGVLAPADSGFVWGSIKSLFRLLRALVSLGFAKLSLRITVASLIAGIHVETEDLNELITTENAILDAAKNVKGFLANAAKYDGSEVLVEV